MTLNIYIINIFTVTYAFKMITHAILQKLIQNFLFKENTNIYIIIITVTYALKIITHENTKFGGNKFRLAILLVHFSQNYWEKEFI